MNRQEAYEFLVRYIDNYDPDDDYSEFCDAMRCVRMLAPNKPDPETGLLPCGCGGKAIRVHIPHETKTKITCVACETCFVTTPYLEDDEAKDVWNRAMGGL